MNIDELGKNIGAELKAWLAELAYIVLQEWEVPSCWASVGWHGFPGG